MSAPELPPHTGFGNHFASEARSGALPQGRNSPQCAPHGLYAELLSGTAFTAPRAENRRTWVYRVRPSAAHNAPFEALPQGLLRCPPCDELPTPPDPLRWSTWPIPEEPMDFVQGLATVASCGDARLHQGASIHLWRANRSMERSALYNADGEMLLVPQQGRLRITTELGVMNVAPGEIAVIPRGLRFAVALPDEYLGQGARGYVCENHGAPFRLPELGPIGSNGLANPRDFITPQAAFIDDDEPWELRAKLGGRLWSSRTSGSPFDVVAWHGNLVPYQYDLARFMAIGSISFDHPDPSIYTVLTAPSDVPSTANVDFVIFPPRWLVAEDTFRPPWFHRNVMSEFMGLVHGVYDAKAEGFVPGGASLHNSWSAHGPDGATYEQASQATLTPHKIDDTLAFMFETRFLLQPTAWAMGSPERQGTYTDCWLDLQRHFDAGAPHER